VAKFCHRASKGNGAWNAKVLDQMSITHCVRILKKGLMWLICWLLDVLLFFEAFLIWYLLLDVVLCIWYLGLRFWIIISFRMCFCESNILLNTRKLMET
jgi:hypothetical protein